MRKLVAKIALAFLSMAFVLNISQPGMAGVPKDRAGKTRSLAKTAIVDRPFWAPNRIGTYISNDGYTVDWHPTGSAGMEWPVGSGNHIHFAGGGIWIAGIKDGEIVTAATEFVTEFQPGKVNQSGPGVVGVPENPQDPRFKVYVINRADVADPLRNPDYTNWPAADGAPVNADGTPALVGSDMTWAVYNDYNQTLHDNLFETKFMGVEVRRTIWAFNRPDAFGDMLFVKFEIENKSGKDIADTYLSTWNDIDVGDALDLIGCDTTLSLGFNYKTQADGLYGANPPAIGFDFFQGPIVPSPGDVANVSGTKVPDFKNLPMGSFAKYINGGPPQLSDPEVGSEAYNFMKGFDKFGDPIINEQTGQVTKFFHPGDPVAGTGWLDTDHRDKRFLMTAGPFTLADGDAQEFVVGIVIAQGNTGTQSVELLKRNDAVAQLAYDINFSLPPSPSNPVVTVSTQEQVITLHWDAAAEAYEALDRVDLDSLGNPTKYTFQGYNVYQLNSATITAETSIKKIASFDLQDGIVKIRDDVFLSSIGQTANIVVQEAQDTGMQRWFRINADALSGNAPLIQNRKYYLAVTAYGYNPIGIPKVLESPIQVIGREQGIRPQSPVLGTRIVSQFGDSLSFTRVSGGSDGSIQPIIVDPSRLTGDSYEVRFRQNDAGESVYDVINTSKGNTTVAEGFKNQSNALGTQDYPVVGGVIVVVNGPALTFKNFETVANAAGPLDPPEGGAFDFGGFPSARPTDRQQSGAGLWGIHTGDAGSFGDFDAFINRVTNGETRWPNIIPYDFELRFTAAGGYGYDGFASGDIIPVPFELWRVGIGTPDDPSDDVRMIPYIIDQDGDKTFNLSGWGDGSDPNAGQPEHSVSGADNDPQTDWIYWAFPDDPTPGDAGYKAWEAAALALPPSPVSGLPSDADATGSTTQSFFNVLVTENTIRRMVLVNWNGGSAPPFNQDLPETGTIFRITSTKPNSPADVFAFSTPQQIRNDQALAQGQAAELINVYPNPYRGFNIEEKDPANRFVTFTHLPGDNTTIQIFSLSGDLVRRIVHDNGTQFEQWDLRNSSDVPVASGIYIARIDMGGVGVKLLKLAILQAQERLDVF